MNYAINKTIIENATKHNLVSVVQLLLDAPNYSQEALLEMVLGLYNAPHLSIHSEVDCYHGGSDQKVQGTLIGYNPLTDIVYYKYTQPGYDKFYFSKDQDMSLINAENAEELSVEWGGLNAKTFFKRNPLEDKKLWGSCSLNSWNKNKMAGRIVKADIVSTAFAKTVIK